MVKIVTSEGKFASTEESGNCAIVSRLSLLHSKMVLGDSLVKPTPFFKNLNIG